MHAAQPIRQIGSLVGLSGAAAWLSPEITRRPALANWIRATRSRIVNVNFIRYLFFFTRPQDKRTFDTEGLDLD